MELFRAGSTVVKLHLNEKQTFEIIRAGCAYEETVNVLENYNYFKLD